MRKKTLSALALAALLTLAVPSVAQAATDDNYTPVSPTGSTLVGSTATGTCVEGAPWIDFTVKRTNPQPGASNAASLVLTDGTNTLDVPLGELQDDTLSGRIAWPAALWTHGDVDATLVAGPSVAVPLSYPSANAACDSPSGVAGISTTNTTGTSSSSALPATGMSAAVLPIGIAGGVLALLGTGLLITRRLVRR